MNIYENMLSDMVDFFLVKISKKSFSINTKEIRKYHNISPSNRSKINFIWRILIMLEDKSFISLKNRTSSKKNYYISGKLITYLEPINTKKIEKNVVVSELLTVITN